MESALKMGIFLNLLRLAIANIYKIIYNVIIKFMYFNKKGRLLC